MKLMNLVSVSLAVLLLSVGISNAAETAETPTEIKRIKPILVPPPTTTNPSNPVFVPPAQPQLSPSEQLQRDVMTFLQLNQFDNAEYRLKVALTADPNDPVALSLLKRVQDTRNETLGRALRQRMEGMMLEEVHFTGAPVSAVVEYLQDETRRFSEKGEAINIVLNVPQGIENVPVNLKLRNVPILEVLKYVCESAKLNFRVDQHAVVISSAAEVPPVETPR